MRMCVYRSAARRPLQMERLAQTLLCCVAVRYDCFYQRRVPTTVGQWVAKLANGTNGAARRGTPASTCHLAGLSGRRANAKEEYQSHHTRGQEYEGVWQRTVALQREEACGHSVPSFTLRVEGHKPTSATNQEELREATLTEYRTHNRKRGSRAARIEAHTPPH